MRRILILVTIISFLSSCAPSVGRKVVESGKFEIELTVGGAFFYYTSIPLPLPNVGLGVRYGVIDRFNIGGRVYPLSTLFGSLLFETYIVGEVYESSDTYIPSINVYSLLNYLAFLGYFDMTFYPLVGTVGVWKFGWGSVYVPLEVSFDFYSQRRPVKFNLGVGLDFFVTDNFGISAELRVNSIGNIYLPLGNMVGVPVFFVSTHYRF
ncbi:MAG: hypothetical protein RMJ37_05330 [Spirochaetia bacterium]|nr:hypothetical protein [Spirochaetota bacterium]MDW8112738.1 hypothetical protein [Spirochaetia bacterium]